MNRYLSLLVAIKAIFLVTLPVWGESNIVSEVKFICQNGGGSFSTAAKNIDGSLQQVFHWQDNISLQYEDDTEQLCRDTTQRLNRYFAKGYNPYVFELSYSSEFIIPVICILKQSKCGFILLSIPATANDIKETRRILNQILDEDLQTDWTERGDLKNPHVKIKLFH